MEFPNTFIIIFIHESRHYLIQRYAIKILVSDCTQLLKIVYVLVFGKVWKRLMKVAVAEQAHA
jgi:hypothetical protein